MIKPRLSVRGGAFAHFGFCRFSFEAALSLISLLLWLTPPASRAAPTPLFLHARGQDIVNGDGDKVLLRGVSLGNWLLPEGYMWKFGSQGDRPRKIEKIVNDLIGPENAARFWTEYRRNYIAEADIERIAQLGYNSVRPALNSRLFLDANGAPDDSSEGFQLLDHLVAWCKADGVYVVIDMHAAPGGQTGQNIDDSAHDQPELFTEPKYQDQLIALWTAIARRYRGEAAVAGFDLLNEPLPKRTGAAASYKSQLEPLYRRITRAIRQVDARHSIIVEGADWANDWSVFSAPFDSNMVYQFHYYCWDSPPVVKSIRNYLRYREQFQSPVWVGETGEKDDAIYWATTQYFEANNIGWSFWPWKKMDTRNTPFSIKPPVNWDQIAEYSRGGDKPPRDVAQNTLNQLLVNIRLENCVFFPDVVHAMLREAPGRIEAENFGVDGPNESYSVENTNSLSRFYRLDQPVPIISHGSDRRRSEQYVVLKTAEWTSYSVRSREARPYSLKVRVKAEQSPCQIRLDIRGQARLAEIPNNEWSEIKLDPVDLEQGINRIKWTVVTGVADLDWLELDSPGESSVVPGEPPLSQ